MKRIILFDVDGTLLNVEKSFINRLVENVLTKITGPDIDFKNIPFAGRTDRDIFEELVSIISADNKSPEVGFQELKQAYLEYVDQKMEYRDVKPIKGAEEAIRLSVENGYDIGLCTGNFRETAYKKVEAAGFENVFSFGGFGCNHADRKYLPDEAHKEFVALKGFEPKREQYVVIGDTPNDIRCAKHFGAVSVAVTTGSFGADQLQTYNPDLLVENAKEAIQQLL